MAECNSRAVGLDEMTTYCQRRLRTLEVSLEFYSLPRWRGHRRKTHIRRQQSEERVFARFKKYRLKHPDFLMTTRAWRLRRRRGWRLRRRRRGHRRSGVPLQFGETPDDIIREVDAVGGHAAHGGPHRPDVRADCAAQRRCRPGL
jgi:hypothetical protein